MNRRMYRICLTVPLGDRSGTLLLREKKSCVDGYIDVMNRKNPFTGIIADDGRLVLSGAVSTLMNTVNYTAMGTVGGGKISLKLRTDSGVYYSLVGEERPVNGKVLQTHS